MRHRLVIELDVDLLDGTWSERELLENAVHFLQGAIDRAEAKNAEATSEPAYVCDTSDMTVWTQAGYREDLAGPSS